MQAWLRLVLFLALCNATPAAATDLTVNLIPPRRDRF